MISYIDSLLESVAIVELLDNWQSKKDEDIGWVYVEFCFDGESEAVAVTVTQEVGRCVINKVEWGRP